MTWSASMSTTAINEAYDEVVRHRGGDLEQFKAALNTYAMLLIAETAISVHAAIPVDPALERGRVVRADEDGMICT